MIRRTSGYQNIQREILGTYRQNTAQKGKAALHIGTGKASSAGCQYVLEAPLMKKMELRDNGRLLELSESGEANRQNDLYRNAKTGSISRMGYTSGILDLSSLVDNSNADSCFRGTISDGGDVDYYHLTTMIQMISRRPVYITMEAVEGSDVRMTVYDKDGNQVGMSEENEDGTRTLKVPCDWSSSASYTLKIEGAGSEEGEVPYKLTFRQGEMDPEFKALLEKNKKKSVYETPVEGKRTDEENRWHISEMLTIHREDKEEAMKKLHQEQYEALPAEKQYHGGETPEEILARKRNGEKLTEAEEEYLRIYGNLKDMADLEAEERIRKTHREVKQALSEAGIDPEAEIHVEIKSDGTVLVSGLPEEENKTAAAILEERFAADLKNAYLAKSETVKKMTDYEYRVAMFTDELNRVLSKASGGRITMDDIRIVDRNEGGFMTDYYLEGLPASLDRLINHPSQDSIYEEYQSMCYAVLGYRQGMRESPDFHVRMDIGIDGIMFE